jgi:2-methylcitrate dehydratase PrpD
LNRQDPVVDRIVTHLARVAADGVPHAVRAAAKTFIADSLAVGIAGVKAPWRAEVLDMACAAGSVAEASVWGSGERLPLAQAATVNAYQVHCQEFDCVHEGAVVHPMAAVLACGLGWAERAGSVSGERLIRAVVAGVDVAVTLGLCSRAPMRFFRPCPAVPALCRRGVPAAGRGRPRRFHAAGTCRTRHDHPRPPLHGALER